MMIKRSKKLEEQISIDRLPTSLEGEIEEENGEIMSGSGGGGGVNGSSRDITRLIGIKSGGSGGAGAGIGFFTALFRKRKNFSLILFVGLSALVCALYYTSYYPGAMWTLRLGVTSFSSSSGSRSRQQQKEKSLLLAERINLNNKRNNDDDDRPSGGGGGGRERDFYLSSGFDGRKKPSASGRDNDKNNDVGERSSSGSSQVISTLVQTGDDHDNNEQGGGGGGDKTARNNNNGNTLLVDDGEEGESENGDAAAAADDEEQENNSPKTSWDWKSWARLEYWKINLEEDDHEDDKDGEKVSRRHLEKIADESLSVSERHVKSKGKKVKLSATFVKTAGEMEQVPRSSAKRASCNFPRLNPFDPSITDFLRMPPVIDCSQNYPLVFRTNFRNKLIRWAHPFPVVPAASSVSLSSAGGGGGVEDEKEDKSGEGGDVSGGNSSKNGNYSCCYKTITRGNGSDHNVIFSKRCYPIVKTETEIPAVHEFISVRCKNLATGGGGGGGRGSKINNGNIPPHHNNNNGINKGPPKENNKTNNNNFNDRNNNINSSSSTATTATTAPINHRNNSRAAKVYKDMLAFVPLKPLVEDRIRKYEESKRKLLYETNKQRQNGSSSSSSNANGESGSKHYQSESVYREKASRGTGIHANDRLSVVLLGLDAQSHMNFIRQMPQTYNYLTRNLSAVGLYGYTKVGDNTFPNVVSLLSGLSVDQLAGVCWPTKDSYFDSCPFIWKDFAKSGYRTSLAEDSVWMGTFNYEKKGFIQPPTDYYLHPLSLLMAKKIGHETWANAKLCYGPRLAFEVLLEYIVKTATTFRDSLYFQFVWANSLFHDYLNHPRLGDELLYMTLQYLSENGYLNNTAFILLSDHGIRWGSIRSTYQGKIEERMPLVYFTFPQWFRTKYPEAMRNLGRNVLRLSTPFDVHHTLRDILRLSKGENVRFDRWTSNDDDDDDNGGNNKSRDEESYKSPPKGISLFRLLPLQRTCKMAGIEEHWCVCHSMQNVPINSTLVQSGARFIVQVINGLVSKQRQFCAKLKLFKINEAKRKIDGDIDRGLDINFIEVPPQQEETPGGGDQRSSTRASTYPNRFKSSKKTEKVGSSSSGKENAAAAAAGAIVTSSDSISSSGSNIVTATESSFFSSLSTSSDIKKMIQLQIVIVTTPGHAVFEATIYGEAEIVNRPVVDDRNIDEEAGQRSIHHWKLSGDISRLNLYGEQSACVSDYSVQKYCYCHNLDNAET